MNILKPIKKFFVNLRALSRVDLYNHRECARRFSLSDKKNDILMYFLYHPEQSEKYQNELRWLSEHSISMYPYNHVRHLNSIDCLFDSNLHMWYVLHKGKKLYYPKDYNRERAVRAYSFSVESENLLRENYLEKRPHQYMTDDFQFPSGGVFVDCGAAEALVTLDVVEEASRIIVIEADSRWNVALKATFAPWKEKIKIINKFIGAVDDKRTIRLQTILELIPDEVHSFVKMDIEGYEVETLLGSEEYLKEHNNIQMAVCTYHNHTDAQQIEDILERAGFLCSFTDGYVVMVGLDLEPPYFRKAIIRANK